ncbi:DUF4826 family protein [Pleionea sediminis]|uniref:DUF4826 family protein n=1 Tax=Pleionea sediminis TaxID=2569479 RepID=UPI0011855874|nr:DUF4826 family protein [Pleionea sediminis]
MAVQPAHSFKSQLKLLVDWQDLDEWTRLQLLQIENFCHHHGWTLRRISDQQSKVMTPIVSIWQVVIDNQGVQKVAWMISGDLPVDMVYGEKAKDARDAVRVFSRKFIRKAQMLKQASAVVPSDEKSKMQRLVKAAADLLVLYHEDSLWEES